MDVLLLELVHQVIGQHLTLGPRGRGVVPWDVGVHTLVSVVEAHGASKCACSTTLVACKSILVSNEEPLSLLELAHEFCLGATVVPIDIEEVVDSLAILLIELSTESSENCLELFDVDILIVVDITASEQLLVGDLSIVQDGQEFEHGSMLERAVVVCTISWEMLLT